MLASDKKLLNESSKSVQLSDQGEADVSGNFGSKKLHRFAEDRDIFIIDRWSAESDSNALSRSVLVLCITSSSILYSSRFSA